MKEAALILLFRFLFILYAEDRGLLPIRNPHYQDYSFQRLRDDAAAVVEGRRAAVEHGGRYWGSIKDLFKAIAQGSDQLGLPEYNGGLFENAAHPLLTRVLLGDATLARLLDDLSRAALKEGRRVINYRDLSVHPGS